MRNLMGAALAAGFLLVGIGAASADDNVRLGGPAAQAAISGGLDTELVHYGRGGGYGYRGGYHGGYGYRGGYGYYRGGYGYYRGGYGYYRGGYGYYRGGYGYYPPYYGSYYYPRYVGYYAPTYYYPPTYCYPIAGDPVAPPVTQTNVYFQSSARQPLAPPASNGTFPYDGGPRSPIPMPAPGQETNPASKPGGTLPQDGRLVLLPTQMTGGTSQYGVVSSPTATPRVSYPAYGDEPITPSPRKR